MYWRLLLIQIEAVTLVSASAVAAAQAGAADGVPWVEGSAMAIVGAAAYRILWHELPAWRKAFLQLALAYAEAIKELAEAVNTLTATRGEIVDEIIRKLAAEMRRQRNE